MGYPAFYNDPKFDYRAWWQKRHYEHLAEINALNKMFSALGRKKWQIGLEIGAGFGRLVPAYAAFFEKVVLLEPAQKQLNLAKQSLKNFKTSQLQFVLGQAENLPFADTFFDGVVMIRVLHHLTNISKVFSEVFRVLKPGGFFILEFANKTHLKNRLLSLLPFQKLSWRSQRPWDRRSREKQKPGIVPFYNYHPRFITNQLKVAGFLPRKKLSVSNLRWPILKKIFPLSILLFGERVLQLWFSRWDLGPSIFVLAQKPYNGNLTNL